MFSLLPKQTPIQDILILSAEQNTDTISTYPITREKVIKLSINKKNIFIELPYLAHDV